LLYLQLAERLKALNFPAEIFFENSTVVAAAAAAARGVEISAVKKKTAKISDTLLKNI